LRESVVAQRRDIQVDGARAFGRARRRRGMRRALAAIIGVGVTAAFFAAQTSAQGDGGYKLVPNWPHLPAGMYFGLKEPPLPPAERDAQAAARRAAGRANAGGGGQTSGAGPTNQP